MMWAAVTVFADLPAIDITDPETTVIRTGGIDPLITRAWDLELTSLPNPPWVRFDFAFATEELPRDGQVSDSANFYIQDSTRRTVSVLAAVDGGGVKSLPPTEGAFPISPMDVRVEEMDFPALAQALPFRASQRWRVRLPTAFQAGRVRFVMQVFDYPNGLESVAVVPPPKVVSPPVVDAGPALGIPVGVLMDRQVSLQDPGSTSWSAQVDYGDGTSDRIPPHILPAFRLRHAFPPRGMFRVKVEVTDDDGEVGLGEFLVVTGPPTLFIQQCGVAEIQLSWPAHPALFRLETALGVSGLPWAEVPVPIRVGEGIRHVVLPLDGSQTMFRLQWP